MLINPHQVLVQTSSVSISLLTLSLLPTAGILITTPTKGNNILLCPLASTLGLTQSMRPLHYPIFPSPWLNILTFQSKAFVPNSTTTEIKFKTPSPGYVRCHSSSPYPTSWVSPTVWQAHISSSLQTGSPKSTDLTQVNFIHHFTSRGPCICIIWTLSSLCLWVCQSSCSGLWLLMQILSILKIHTYILNTVIKLHSSVRSLLSKPFLLRVWSSLAKPWSLLTTWNPSPAPDLMNQSLMWPNCFLFYRQIEIWEALI